MSVVCFASDLKVEPGANYSYNIVATLLLVFSIYILSMAKISPFLRSQFSLQPLGARVVLIKLGSLL